MTPLNAPRVKLAALSHWRGLFTAGLLLVLSGCPAWASTDTFAARIRQASLIEGDSHWLLQAHIDYQLSPTAKEALLKGIPLSWLILIEIRAPGQLWDSVLYRQKLPYRLRFHALLNQFEVSTPGKRSEMFLTLNAALGFMAALHDAKPITASQLPAGQPLELALKTRFQRESLPVPLRPFTYLDSQWFLSSDWYLWPIPR